MSVRHLLKDVRVIYATSRAFAALKKDGSVVTWGDSRYGGNSGSVQSNLVNVKKIYSTWGAFAALKLNGQVETWGDSAYGGDSSSVQDRLVNVKSISSMNNSFAALKNDGKVISWGGLPNTLTGIEKIYPIYSNTKKPEVYGELKDKRASLCMSVNPIDGLDNVSINLNSCNGSRNTLWSYDEKSGHIKTKLGNYCVTGNNSFSGTLLFLAKCDDKMDLQKWSIDDTTDSIHLRSFPTSTLDAYGTSPYSDVGIWSFHGGPNQRWSVDNIK
jgi:alpha-tubulin suppressor-like RCC1 family protein